MVKTVKAKPRSVEALILGFFWRMASLAEISQDLIFCIYSLNALQNLKKCQATFGIRCNSID